MSNIQVLVAAQTLAQRINRVLARRRLWLRKTPKNDTKALKDFGEYFVFDMQRNRIAETHIDIEDYARKLGVLRPHESLERAPRPDDSTASVHHPPGSAARSSSR